MRDGIALAIETSGTWGGVAVGLGDRVLAVKSFDLPRHHAAEFLPCVATVFREAEVLPAQVSEVYISIGPGSFTGLRIGLTAARMLALATRARIVAVPTLEVIAQNAFEADPRPKHVVAVLDARRGKVYAGSFTLHFQSESIATTEPAQASSRQREKYEPATEPVECDPREYFSRQPPGCAVLGEGLARPCHAQAAADSGLRILPEPLSRPRAQVVFQLGAARAALGLFRDPRTLTPAYIRLPEPEEKWRQRRGQAEVEPDLQGS